MVSILSFMGLIDLILILGDEISGVVLSKRTIAKSCRYELGFVDFVVKASRVKEEYYFRRLQWRDRNVRYCVQMGA